MKPTQYLPEEEWGCTVWPFEDGSWVQVSDDGNFYMRCAAGDTIDDEAPVDRLRLTYEPLSVLGRTTPSDITHPHGVALRYRTHGGQTVTDVVQCSLVSDLRVLKMWLADNGIRIEEKGFKFLVRYLTTATSSNALRSYGRTGWHCSTGEGVFVLGDGVVIGDETAVYQPTEGLSPAPTAISGTLDDWKLNVAVPAEANPLWSFSIMTSFAAPLLKPLGENGRGFHVVGRTSSGKTLGLRCAASVFGRAAKGGDSLSYVRTWNSTANALEGLCEGYSDLLLPLDELSEGSTSGIAQNRPVVIA
jgi:uncharacterized protein (DUF927 family)